MRRLILLGFLLVAVAGASNAQAAARGADGAMTAAVVGVDVHKVPGVKKPKANPKPTPKRKRTYWDRLPPGAMGR
jgi:hypothetical protein